jgi:hypothetical protein
MLRRATAVRRTVTGVGAAGVVVGCAGMAAMLPGIFATAVGAVGIGGASTVARTL